MSLQPGQMHFHYRIVEKIGEGGIGEAYRAEDEHLDGDVAVEVLQANYWERWTGSSAETRRHEFVSWRFDHHKLESRP